MTRFLSNTLITISLLFLAGCSSSPNDGGEYGYRAQLVSGATTTEQNRGLLWRQIAGPNQSAIHCPTCPRTDVYGLVLGTYEFELSFRTQVYDTATQQMKDTTVRDSMKVFVLAPPLLFRLLDFRAKAFEFYNLVEWEIEQAGDKVELLRNNRVIMTWTDRAKVAFKDYGFEGISRYQLRQTDDAGKVALSEIITIANRPKANRIIAAGDVFTIVSRYRTRATVSVYNHAGALMVQNQVQLEVGPNRFTTPLAHLAAGLYVVSVHCSDFQITERIWKGKHF